MGLCVLQLFMLSNAAAMLAEFGFPSCPASLNLERALPSFWRFPGRCFVFDGTAANRSRCAVSQVTVETLLFTGLRRTFPLRSTDSATSRTLLSIESGILVQDVFNSILKELFHYQTTGSNSVIQIVVTLCSRSLTS